MGVIREVRSNLKNYSIGFCKAFIAENFGDCMRRRKGAIKLYTQGLDQLDNNLDIVNLIRTSIEFKILKNLLLSADQRKKFKKQRRQAFNDESDHSSSGSDDLNDKSSLHLRRL